jgi:uncharacterized protein
MSAGLLLALTGLLGGFVGGLFGVGGGLIFVPLLVLLKKMDPHAAVGTSLAAVAFTAVSGAWKHAGQGWVDWKAVLILGLFALVGSWIGASVSLQLGTLLLRRLFAMFLLFLAVKMFFPN